jgi:hypothetical protein
MEKDRKRRERAREAKGLRKAEEREESVSRSHCSSRLLCAFLKVETLDVLLVKTPHFDAIVFSFSLPAFLLCFFRPILFAVFSKS